MSKKSFWQLKDGSRGFALLEVMVAMGILGVVTLGIMKTTQMGQKTAKKLSYDQNVLQKMAEITSAMRDRATCKGLLQGKTFAVNAPAYTVPEIKRKIFNPADTVQPIQVTDPATPRTIVKSDAAKVYADGTPGAYLITQLEIKNDENDAGVAHLNVTFTKRAQNTTDSSWGGSTIVRTVDIKTVDSYVNAEETSISAEPTYAPDGLIDDCYVDENSIIEATCSIFNGKMVDGKCVEIKIDKDPGDVDGIGVYSANGVAVESGGLLVGALGAGGPGSGNIKADDSIDIGANGTFGDSITVTNNATIGKDLKASNNKFRVETNTFQTELITTIGNNATITKDLQVNKSATVNNSLTVGSGGAVVKGGGLTVVGGIDATDDSSTAPQLAAGVIRAKNIYIEGLQMDANIDGKLAVTKDWVMNMLTKQFVNNISAADREKILNHLLSSTSQQDIDTLAKYFRDNTLTFLSGFTAPGAACTTGQAIQAMQYDAGTETVTVTCIDMAGCSSQGACQTVYSSSPDGVKSFCYNTGTSTAANYQCVTSFKVGVRALSCQHKKLSKRTIGISGEVQFYGECGTDRFMRGTFDRFVNSGDYIMEKWIICCNPKVL